VSDGRGGITTCSKEVTISGDTPPVAFVEVDQTSGDAPLTVEFDASGSFDTDGDSLMYSFDFGDGNSISIDNAVVSHTYGPGEYTYSVYVSDATSDSFIKTGGISVNDPQKETRDYTVEVDALLDADSPDSNFGDVENSLISELDKHGIFRFDFSANTDTILTAKLYIPAKFGNNPCAVKYVADDSWSETAVTWNNQPASGDELATAVYDGDWAVFEITEAIIAETDKVISVLLYEKTSGWQEFRYKETSWDSPFLQLEVQLDKP
jgi:PKD repeat protein